MKTEQTMNELPARITSFSPPQATEIREKPHYPSFYRAGNERRFDFDGWTEAWQDYELSRIPMLIENAELYDGYSLIVDVCERTKLTNQLVKLNQSVQVVRTGDKTCKITKI